MGGRGSSSGEVKTVAYDKWGKLKQGSDIQYLYDGDDFIGTVEDVLRYNSVEDIYPIKLVDAKRDLKGWLNDKDDEYGWSYGNEDTSFFVAYDDGTQMGDDDLDGKKFKMTGIIGIAIQTGDYEMVAGDEWVRRDGRMERQPIQTWSEDGESGQTNVYSGYKSTETWIERVKTTYNNPAYDRDGNFKGYRVKRTVLKKSTRKKLR